MSLTEKEAFKLGFLARCAEEHLRGDALEARIAAAGAWAGSEKTSNLLFKYSPYSISPGLAAEAAGSAVKGITGAGIGMLTLPYVLAPMAAGAAGYSAAKMIEPTISDEDVKAQELAATYKLYADKAKARRKSRKYRREGGSEY